MSYICAISQKRATSTAMTSVLESPRAKAAKLLLLPR